MRIPMSHDRPRWIGLAAVTALTATACGAATASARRDAARSTASTVPATAPATPSATPVLTPLPGPVADGGGAMVENSIFQRVDDMTIPPNCAALADHGYTASCGAVQLDGSEAVWLVEHAPDPESTDQTQLWYAHVYVHGRFGLAGNVWALFFVSGLDPIDAASVAVTTMPGPTPGTSLLLVGRRRDDGLFAYDVIAGVPGDLPVVAGGGLNMVQGSVVIQGGELVDDAGICPDQSESCTPSSFTKRELGYSPADQKLHVLSSSVVTGPVPRSVLP